MRLVVLESAPQFAGVDHFDLLMKAARGGRLVPCPYGGGKKCRSMGGDGAQWHYTGYKHPKEHQKEEAHPEQMEFPGMETPKQPESGFRKFIGQDAHDAGIEVKAFVKNYPSRDEDDEEDEEDYEYWDGGGEHVEGKDVGGHIDEHVYDLIGQATLDDILDMFMIQVGEYSTKLESISSSFYDEEHDRETPVLDVSGIIVNGEGEKVGSFDRKFQVDEHDDIASVYHQYFVLDREIQGSGIGKEFLRSSMKKYKEMGIEKVTVSPAWIGRYTWAKMGFSYGEGGAEYIREEMPRWLVDEYDMDYEDAIDVVDAHADYPWELASLQVEGEPVGKEFLLSSYGDEVWEAGERYGQGHGFIYLNDSHGAYQHMKSYLGL